MFTFFKNYIDFNYLCFLPEVLLLLLVCILILVAVSQQELKKKSYFTFSLNNFLTITSFFFLFLAFFWMVWLYMNYTFEQQSLAATIFLLYNTLKLQTTLVYVKIILSLLVSLCLYNTKRYLILTNLVSYEYPLIVSLATLGMFVSISANNWILFFLALELQALCFLVLFAWNRRNLRAITASLKFAIVNFIASLLILLGIVEIVLYTQTFNMYLANPLFFFKELCVYNGEHTVFIEWLRHNNDVMLSHYYKFNTNQLFDFDSSVISPISFFTAYYKNIDIIYVLKEILVDGGIKRILLWDIISFLFIIGFAIKLGLAPFGLWLQDLYNSISLPVLTFFATAPKITYITILLSLYVNLFAFVNPIHFLSIMTFLSIISMIVANVAMFSIRNNLLKLFAWSSIANMSLLFFVFSQYPFNFYTFMFIFYYTFGTVLFFSALQYIIIEDNNNKRRHVLYFSDLSVLRQHEIYRPLFILFSVSLLNFFGIPPLVGFWMKYAAIQALVVASNNFISWFLVILLLLLTLVGSYNYLRLFYVIAVENNNSNLNMVYLPNTKDDSYSYVLWFIVMQFIGSIYYYDFTNIFNSVYLFMSF